MIVVLLWRVLLQINDATSNCPKAVYSTSTTLNWVKRAKLTINLCSTVWNVKVKVKVAVHKAYSDSV